MIQSVIFTSTASEAFAKAYLCFLVPLQKNAEVIKFLGVLKNMSPRKKYIFVQEGKAVFCLIKKLKFSFTLDFITQIIYCIINRCLCFHFILFCSLISVNKQWNIETMLTFSYSYNWQKLITTK